MARKLTRIKFTKGKKTTHYQIYNCPCPDSDHPVGVTNHLPGECRQIGHVKRQLGIHAEDFQKA